MDAIWVFVIGYSLGTVVRALDTGVDILRARYLSPPIGVQIRYCPFCGIELETGTLRA